MKYLIFIFAAFFTSLSILPCMDAAASQKDCGTEVHWHETGDQHPDETSQELCSPFCSCHCCQIHKEGVATSESAFIPLVDGSRNNLTPILLSKEFFSIWHPPKV